MFQSIDVFNPGMLIFSWKVSDVRTVSGALKAVTVSRSHEYPEVCAQYGYYTVALLLEDTPNKGHSTFNLSVKDKFSGPYSTMAIP